MKKKIPLLLITFSLLISITIIFKSEAHYLLDLVKTIAKTKRTVADISDYKFFDNITIPESENPKSWPFHENYNETYESKRLSNLHKELGTVAFLIIKNDSILHEKYFLGYNEKSHSNSFSMAKSIVTAVLGRAIDEGFFSGLDHKVGDFVPEFSKGLASNLTVGDLSSMSSGMKWTEDYKNIFGVTARAVSYTHLTLPTKA